MSAAAICVCWCECVFVCLCRGYALVTIEQAIDTISDNSCKLIASYSQRMCGIFADLRSLDAREKILDANFTMLCSMRTPIYYKLLYICRCPHPEVY